jgi:acyl carrier protein
MNLWRRVANELTDVRLGVNVLSVERLADCVRVRTDSGTFEFDDLVLALPLEQSLAFLDANDEERALFSRIRYNTYFTSVCSVRGLPRDGFYIVVQHSQGSSTKGRCTAFHHRYQDSDVYTIYSYLPPGGTLADVERIVGEDVARLGGELAEIHTQRRWEFFPHVLSSDVKASWFQRLEALQGQRRTFYAGSVLSFELIECTIAYSRELVTRFFEPVAGGVRAVPMAAASRSDDRRHDRSADEIRRWLVDHLAAELGMPPSSIDPHAAVERFGIDSVTANSLLGQFTDWIGFRVTPAVLVEHPTIDAVARYLAGEEYQ